MWAAEMASRLAANPYSTDFSGMDLVSGLSIVREHMLAALGAHPRDARARLRVFERNGRPCLSCGTRIRRGRIGVPPQDRPTYWCPNCQPAPVSGID